MATESTIINLNNSVFLQKIEGDIAEADAIVDRIRKYNAKLCSLNNIGFVIEFCVGDVMLYLKKDRRPDIRYKLILEGACIVSGDSFYELFKNFNNLMRTIDKTQNVLSAIGKAGV